MDDSEIRRRKRIRQAYARLGTSMPACANCGENEPSCLEKHEPGGRKYNDVSVILCRNCHCKQSDHQREHPGAIWIPPDEHERIAHSLLGVADYFQQLGPQLRVFAEFLLKQSRKEATLPSDDDAEPQ